MLCVCVGYVIDVFSVCIVEAWSCRRSCMRSVSGFVMQMYACCLVCILW